MSVRVKICGLSKAGDIRAAVDAGADAIGFVFYAPSPRNLTIEQAIELASSVPEHVLKVAVMLHPDAAACDAILAALSPDVLQTDANDFARLVVPQHIKCWPVLREPLVDDVVDLPQRFVYEGPRSGQGVRVDWQTAAGFARRGELILGGGLDPQNVAGAIRAVRPWAVDVSSGVESSPGKKDQQKIRKFIAAAKAAGGAKGQ